MPVPARPLGPSDVTIQQEARQGSRTGASLSLRLVPGLSLARPVSLARWEQTTWVAAATQFVTLIGFGLSMPFLPLYVQALGVTDRAEVALWSGVLAGCAALTMACMAPIWGILADRYGRKPMLVRSMLGGALMIGAMGYVGDVWQLFGLRLAQGALTGSQAAAAALVAAAAPGSHIGFALGLVSTAVQVGNTVGPALGGVAVGSFGFRGSFLLGGLMLLAGGLMALFWVDEPPQPAQGSHATGPHSTPGGRMGALPGDRVGARRLGPKPSQGGLLARTLTPFTWPGFRDLLVLQLGTQFAFSAAVGLLPIYLQDMQRPDWLSPELASGLSITLTAITAALAMPFLGRWTDTRGPRGLLIASLVGSAIVLAVQALVPTVGLFLALRAVLGVWLAGVTATLSVMTKRGAPFGREGSAYGAASSAQGFGWGAGPILGSGVVALGGIPALYLVCAVVMAALVGLALKPRTAAATL